VPRSAVPEVRLAASAAASGGLSDALVDLGHDKGLSVVGITTAEVFDEPRRILLDRKRGGLHADMQFTYRNPERSTDPSRIVSGARSLVVGAWSYRHQEPAPPPGSVRFLPSRRAGSESPRPVGLESPRPVGPESSRPFGLVARYARRDHYASLRAALAPIADHLRGLGWRAVVVCDDNALVDRAAAHRAALGWFGKNSLMLLPGLGSWFVLGSVVTDAPLVPTTPEVPTPHAQGCRSCSRCLTACPTGALVAPGVLDARRCLAWLLQSPGVFPEEHRRALGGRIYGCDECQEVCPINQVADRRDPPPPAGPESEPWVGLLDLLDATDGELVAEHGRWYIPDRDPRYLRRNALVALGNIGDGTDPATVRALRQWLAVDDAMIVEHAQWAARQLGRDDLVDQDS
jgi:epoxyqueuosine reductase